MKKKIAYGVTGLILGCIFLFPIYILIMNSFKTTKGIFTDVLGFPAKGTFTLENYKNAFQELDYIRSFMNSLLITVVTAVLVLLISAMAAWVLVRYKTKASKIIFLIFAGSMLIPFQCVMLPLVGFASKIGLLSRGGLIFMYMGFQTSMAIIMFHGFIKNIPEELEEAATIDGCGSIRLFISIVLPLMRTIIVTVAVINVMGTWNDFLLPSLIINKQGLQTLPLKIDIKINCQVNPSNNPPIIFGIKKIPRNSVAPLNFCVTNNARAKPTKFTNTTAHTEKSAVNKKACTNESSLVKMSIKF